MPPLSTAFASWALKAGDAAPIGAAAYPSIMRSKGPHEVVEGGPSRCPTGHPLVKGNVLKGAVSPFGRSYLCRTCGLEIQIDVHGTQTVVQSKPT